MWFSRKPQKVIVVLRHEGLDELVAAIRYAAKMKAGKIQPKRVEAELPPLPPHEAAFAAWLAEAGFEENKASHLQACFDIVLGRRAAPPGYTRASCREFLNNAKAPLPLGI